MPYKTERDLNRMLRHQELIESSLSFVSGSEDFIRDNDIFPSGRTDGDVMRGLRYPNGTGVIAGVTSDATVQATTSRLRPRIAIWPATRWYLGQAFFRLSIHVLFSMMDSPSRRDCPR